MRVIVVVTQLLVAVTVEAGTLIYLLQNGMASSICLLSTSALSTLSLLQTFLSSTRGLERAGATASKRAKKIETAMIERDEEKGSTAKKIEEIPRYIP
jgi:hypothetical protein